MLHELLELRTCLFVSQKLGANTAYQRKLEIIENNLYGVDKDEFAVNMARLRLWLSLAVEYEGDAPPALPNLDFKIEIGDSLAGPDPQATFSGQGRLLRQQIQQFREKKRQYLEAHGTAKAKLVADIADLKQRLKEWLHSQAPKDAFDWAVEFAEVFEGKDDRTGGFDIIVANPPYISAVTHAASESDFREALRNRYPLLKGAFDVYAAFLLLGVSIGSTKGSFSWIVPNKVLVANYARPIVAHLKANGMHAAIDVSHHDVFGETGVYPVILLGSRPSTSFDQYEVQSLSDLHRGRLTSRARLRTFQSFKDHGVLIGSGTTGFQAKQIIQYISEKQVKGAIPFVVSGCVDRFVVRLNDVRYMGKRYDRAYIRPNDDVARNKWKFWTNAKIVVAGMTKVIEAVHCTEPLALGVGVYAIHGFGGFLPKYLVALLNSRYLSYYVNVAFKDKHLAGGYLAINKSTLEELPLVKASGGVQEHLAQLVEQIQSAKLADPNADTSVWERQIDEQVERLYELTPEERVAVERSANSQLDSDPAKSAGGGRGRKRKRKA